MENSILVGTLSSVATEILKFIPFLRSNEITIAVTNIVVVAIGVVASTGTLTVTSFVSALGVSIATYLAAVKPVSGNLGLRSQE